MTAVASAPLDLLNLVDILVLLLEDSACVSSVLAFLLEVTAGSAATAGRFANSSILSLDLLNASTDPRIAPFLRNFDSWSWARHSGHFESAARALRMHSEQNVWEQLVIMGES